MEKILAFFPILEKANSPKRKLGEMLRFSGEERFPIPRTRLAEKLSDAAFLAACAPDAVIRDATADVAAWSAKARFSFITSRIDTTLTIVNRLPHESVTFTLANNTTGAGLFLHCVLTFTDEDAAACRVEWVAEITSRTGLLKVVPLRVLRSQIEAELADLWQGVRAKLVQPAS